MNQTGPKGILPGSSRALPGAAGTRLRGGPQSLGQGPPPKGLGEVAPRLHLALLRGEHDRVECQLCPCGLSRGAGEARKGRKQDKFAKRPKRPSGWWEEAPGYPWWAPHPPAPLSPPPHPSDRAAPPTLTGRLGSGLPPTPCSPRHQRECRRTGPAHGTCSTARSPSPWRRRSFPRPWCSVPARRCRPPTLGACHVP